MFKISLITVSCNSAITIKDCLRSVSSQSEKVEHLLLDNNSADDTLDIVESYKGHRVEIVSKEDDGIYDAMNKGINKASGNIIGVLNSDDIYPSNHVLDSVANAFENEAVDVCYGDLNYVKPHNTSRVVRFWRAGQYSSKSFYWGWMPPHPTFFVRRRVYEKYGVFNLNLGSAADYELMLRFMLKHGVKAKYIPEVLVKMRVGGVSSRSIKNRLLANKNDRRAWEVNGLKPYPWTLLLKPLRKIPQWFIR